MPQIIIFFHQINFSQLKKSWGKWKKLKKKDAKNFQTNFQKKKLKSEFDVEKNFFLWKLTGFEKKIDLKIFLKSEKINSGRGTRKNFLISKSFQNFGAEKKTEKYLWKNFGRRQFF